MAPKWGVKKIITSIQRRWLEALLSGEETKHSNPRKFSAYWKRIQERIDEMFENLKWLAENYPEVLTEGEFKTDHERMKTLLYVADKINPMEKTPLLFKILQQTLTKHDIVLTKKRPPVARPDDVALNEQETY